MHMWVHACVHIHIHLTSQLGPPVSLGAPVPLWFLAYGIMLGRYFCLLGWLLDMVFIWIGNLFSFESIYSTEKRSGRMRGVWPSEACTDLLWHEEHGSTLVTWKRCMYSSASLHVVDVFKVFFLEIVLWCTLILEGNRNGKELFSVDLMPTSSPTRWLIYVRVKWELSGQENLNIHPHLADTWGTAVTQRIDMHCIMCSSPVPSDTRQL